MLAGSTIILTLKLLVTLVTLLLLASLAALARGQVRLHGRINTLFFALTTLTVLGFEILLQFVDVKSTFDATARQALRVHLGFSVPSALLLPVMLYTGKTRRRSWHVAVGTLFLILWAGTFITGVFGLPHTP